MRRYLLAVGLVAGLAGQGAGAAAPPYRWQAIATGAGGFVTGLDLSRGGHYAYARTDTGGAYRLDLTAKGASWVRIVSATSMPAAAVNYGLYFGATGIASAPGNEARVFVIWQNSYAGATVFRSDNAGAKWVATGLTLAGENANGPGRQQGEKIAVDPANANVVYTGSQAQGLWRSSNAGATWQQVGAVPSSAETTYGVGNVRFDPSYGVTAGGLTKVIYATVHQTGVFRSDDAGVTWRKLTRAAAAPADANTPLDAATFQHVDVTKNGLFYVIADGQAYRYSGGWLRLDGPFNGRANAVAVDPFMLGRVLLFDGGGSSVASLDAGLTWSAQKAPRRVAADIPWHLYTDENYFSTATVAFSPVTAGKLWTAEGIGVWTSTDFDGASVNWSGRSAGIEQLVSNAVVAPPGGKLVSGHWDRALFTHPALSVFPATHGPTQRFNSGWDIAYAANRPAVLVASVYDHRQCCSQYGIGPDNQSGTSTDGGKTWRVFPSIAAGTTPMDLKFGDIAVASTTTANIVWLPTNSRPPYFTRDGGATWTPSTLYQADGVTPTADPGSHFAYYLARHVLVADPVADGTFYVFHGSENSLYRSTDGGASWTRQGTGGTPGNFNAYNATLRAVPGRSGALCLTAGRLSGITDQPMFCTADAGATWQPLTGTGDVAAFAFGKPASAAAPPTLYLQGRVGGDPGVWCSASLGARWGKLTTYPLGINDVMTAMDGDKTTFGTLYVGFGGNGLAWGQAPAGSGAELCGG